MKSCQVVAMFILALSAIASESANLFCNLRSVIKTMGKFAAPAKPCRVEVKVGTTSGV